MPCKNQKECGFYQKMLPLFEKHIDALNVTEQKCVSDYRSDICNTGLDNGKECTIYKVNICEKYPKCATIKSRTTSLFNNMLFETSLATCLLGKYECTEKNGELCTEEARKKTLNLLAKNRN